ncbi:MAG TPA: bifunctional ADP-dependent NAD(P)H-hydrate dehydratase/NAD(P)H-hydrate epimerase, partial [Acidaminococcaceae bacterium]|nr:bifunctional ADP-dependent NAD(P)H-hydrate dehydratase/NAD(P)H-hydrate epimerase [Acidaminococcaceae bacterium]
YPGVIHAGEVRTADIGMPKPMLSEEEGDRFVITEELVRDLLPLRPKNMHKGAAGRVTLAAGSEGYIGAAALSGFAAVKGGAGLVTLLTPAGARPLLAVKLTEVMVKSLPQTGTGGLSPDAADLLIDESKDGDVLAIGPGLGTSEETQTVVRQALL